MSHFSKNNALSELETLRAHLIAHANATVDTLIAQLECGDMDMDHESPVEIVYPLRATPAILKGTKPTAVIFGVERIAVKTWRGAYTEILRRCNADTDKHAALMSLRNKVFGRKRVILSDSADSMNVPIKLSDGLFVEAFFDTEWLLRILTTQLLDVVHYDYTDISIAVAHKAIR